VITSVVDAGARTCDTTIVVTPSGDGDVIHERHRQYFHREADVRRSIRDAGLSVIAVCEEYTHRPADAATRCATWTTRRPAASRSAPSRFATRYAP
jgi:hypothetical protein